MFVVEKRFESCHKKRDHMFRQDTTVRKNEKITKKCQKFWENLPWNFRVPKFLIFDPLRHPPLAIKVEKKVQKVSKKGSKKHGRNVKNPW